jgi:hypothetical protein
MKSPRWFRLRRLPPDSEHFDAPIVNGHDLLDERACGLEKPRRVVSAARSWRAAASRENRCGAGTLCNKPMIR